jgi:AraC family transcriptional regulator
MSSAPPGPHDRPFEERHDGVCIAAVTHGTFRYRSTLGSAVFAPGALLLGSNCHCFECSHDHGVGDRCLSFRFAPEFLEAVVGAIPGARRMSFTVPRLPPNPALLPIVAAAETARDDGNPAGFEEIALRVAGAVSGAFAESKGRAPAPGADDRFKDSGANRNDSEKSRASPRQYTRRRARVGDTLSASSRRQLSRVQASNRQRRAWPK